MPIGVSEFVQDGEDIAIIALGSMVHRAVEAADILHEKYGLTASVVNARFVKPVDEKMLTSVAVKHKLVLTIEDGTIKGGFGSEVAEFLQDRNLEHVELVRLGIPDNFIQQGALSILHDLCGISVEGITRAVQESNYFKHRPVSAFPRILEHSKAS